MRRAMVVALAACAVAPRAGLSAQEAPPPIADNSFFIEEAYNQESGVVQHINTLLRSRRSWAYSFTQEWPLSGQRHQLSLIVPIAGGLGDVALNYRHQLGGGGRSVAIAPRLTVALPTGDADRGYGTGAVGYQFNLPVSVLIVPQLVTHWNAGAMVTPAIDETIYNAGASAIWLVRPTFNVMLELAWTGAAGSGELIVNPGVRWAHNLGRLQIVPGISFPDGQDIFFYLSFEHPFKSIEPAPAP